MWLRRLARGTATVAWVTAALVSFAGVGWAQEVTGGEAADAMRRHAATQMLVLVVLGLLATFVLLRYASRRHVKQEGDRGEDLVARAMRELEEQERKDDGRRE